MEQKWNTKWNRNGILNGTETEYTMEHKWTYKMEQTWDTQRNRHQHTQQNRHGIHNGKDM